MSPQYGELRPTSGWNRFSSLGYPCKFQLVSRLGSITARHLVVGVSQTLRRWTEGATYIRQGNHNVGHWPTFLVCSDMISVWQRSFCSDVMRPKPDHQNSENHYNTTTAWPMWRQIAQHRQILTLCTSNFVQQKHWLLALKSQHTGSNAASLRSPAVHHQRMKPEVGDVPSLMSALWLSFSVLTLMVRRQERHWACKKLEPLRLCF